LAKTRKTKILDGASFFRQEKMGKRQILGVRKGVIMGLNGNSIR
jgi:hypothetical protein